MKCVITGCTFIQGNRQVSGDLFMTKEGSWVFRWYGEVEAFYRRTIRASRYWERDRIIVIDKDDAVFSDEAKAYLKEWEDLDV